MTRTSFAFRLFALALPLTALVACDQVDPYKRVDMWRPSMANTTNFELQVARASDLVMGRGTDEADGFQAAAAIERYRTDKERALPRTGVSSLGTGAK